MERIKEDLVKLLNDALKLEHAARMQYLSHAERIKGVTAEPIIGRLREIASDEEKHEGKFRRLIGDYLGGMPAMETAETHNAATTSAILQVNLRDEKTAIGFYQTIYKKVMDNKAALPYEFETLEHELRHIIIDEEEHVAELNVLLGK